MRDGSSRLCPWTAESTSRTGAGSPHRAAGVPDVSKLCVGMPHMNAGGLSENWLFRHAGDQLWQAIGARWGGTTDDLRSESGARLYPTFLAVRATHLAPLSA